MTTKNNNSLIVPITKLAKYKYQTIEDLSDINKKLYQSLLVKSREQFIKYTQKGDRYCANVLFEADLADVLNSVGIDNDCNDPIIVEAFATIQRASIEWESPGLNNGVIWKSFSLFSEIKLTKPNGKTVLRWAFPPSLFEMISNPHDFNIAYGKDLESILS